MSIAPLTSIRLNPTLKERLRKVGEARGLTLTDVIHRACEECKRRNLSYVGRLQRLKIRPRKFPKKNQWSKERG